MTILFTIAAVLFIYYKSGIMTGKGWLTGGKQLPRKPTGKPITGTVTRRQWKG